MCGISGIVSKQDLSKSDIERLHASVASLKKRGPDSNGVCTHHNVGLGHTRLAILDTSNAATQPFFSEDQNYVLVFNGEIYNFMDLRRDLEKEGLVFKTHSDTEVLLAQYIRDKEKCLEKFMGFFAFAVLDKRDNSVFIARDRFGIKPLYIYQDEKQILFASELKAIMAFDIKKNINHTVLFQYLQFNYIPGKQCIFKDASKLEPGHYAVIKNNEITTRSYYKIPYERSEKCDLSYPQAQKKLMELLKIMKRLMLL